MTNLVKTWTAARDRLKEAGTESPVIDARLLVDISEPQSVDLFVNGEYKGALSTPVTQLSSLMK